MEAFDALARRWYDQRPELPELGEYSPVLFSMSALLKSLVKYSTASSADSIGRRFKAPTQVLIAAACR
jgi:hypothetical protein